LLLRIPFVRGSLESRAPLSGSEDLSTGLERAFRKKEVTPRERVFLFRRQLLPVSVEEIDASPRTSHRTGHQENVPFFLEEVLFREWVGGPFFQEGVQGQSPCRRKKPRESQGEHVTKLFEIPPVLEDGYRKKPFPTSTTSYAHKPFWLIELFSPPPPPPFSFPSERRTPDNGLPPTLQREKRTFSPPLHLQ